MQSNPVPAHKGFTRSLFAAGAVLLSAATATPGAEGVSAEDTSARLEIRSIVANGASLSTRTVEKVRLPSQPRTVQIGFGPATNISQHPFRIRFKLDGYDERWREPVAEMRVCVRFLGANGDQVAETVFRVSGQSEGWTGAPGTAAYRHRHEAIVVPPRATGFWVVMTSAGPPATLGVYAITNLVVSTNPSNNSAPKIAMPWAFDPADAGGPTPRTPVGWMRDGLRPSMASVIQCSTPSAWGLAIVDDDLNGHAEWHTVKERAVAVHSGDRLRMEWDEAYSFGLGGPVEIVYPNLPAGYYRFRISELSVMGVAGDGETSLAFEVPLAFWRTSWFWVSVLTVAFASAAGGWRYVLWHRLRSQLQQLEQQRAVDRERLRISQDIHDDLGARVTQISLLSAVAQRKPFLPDDARADFGRITQTTRELVSALYETVWAVNPENDNLDALANYLCQMGNQLCSQTQLRCRLEVPDAPPAIPLNSHVRHNIIMAVKEAIHNVIKHAHASEVRLRIAVEPPTLTICVQDNGRGFDPASCPPGHGLANLKRRMESVGGDFTITSRLGTGTDVRLCLRVAERIGLQA